MQALGASQRGMGCGSACTYLYLYLFLYYYYYYYYYCWCCYYCCKRDGRLRASSTDTHYPSWRYHLCINNRCCFYCCFC